MPWRQSPALTWWGCDGNWRGDIVGLGLDQSSFHQIFLPRGTRQFCPGKDTQIRHHPLLLPSMCSWKRLENGKGEFLELKWNFTPFLRWYFSSCFPPSPLFLLMVLGVSRLNQTRALNPGWSPEEQGLAWTLTPKALAKSMWNPLFCAGATLPRAAQTLLFGVASLLQTRQWEMVFGDRNIMRRAEASPCWGCLCPLCSRWCLSAPFELLSVHYLVFNFIPFPRSKLSFMFPF